MCVCVVIPYHFSVITGYDRDAGTSSRVYVIIIGKKNKRTERLWLDLDGKNAFLPGSLDYFTCYGSDVGEIKTVQVRKHTHTVLYFLSSLYSTYRYCKCWWFVFCVVGSRWGDPRELLVGGGVVRRGAD